MSSIVAIGGGEIAAEETRAIDDRIVAAGTGPRPTTLFIPTASRDAADYCDTFRTYYGETLGCETSVLRLVESDPSQAEIESQIADADVIYVGGGDTRFLLDVWRRRGIVPLLRRAWQRGTVLTGLSAGALCWAAGGFGTSITDPDSDHGPVRGTGFLDGVCLLVHATPERRAAFGEHLGRQRTTGIALENNAALEVRDDQWRVLTSAPDAAVYRLTPTDDTYTVQQLPADDMFRALETLR